LTFFAGITLAGATAAGPREQAKRLHDRLTGVPPSAQVLDQMEAKIRAGNGMDAAKIAMENDAFYNVVLKNFATPWTNREQSVFAPLNDYSATVIGMIRDNEPFNRLLSADLLYIGQGSGIPAYSVNNNAHYEYLENQNINLRSSLQPVAQSSRIGLPPEATAGVMTTRAAAKAFFYAGTNRAMFRFTVLNHMCTDLEQLLDTTRPADRIRQDISRSPGGDSRVFFNNCVGCHSGMDPMAQAFAYYNYQYDRDADPEGNNGRLVYNSAPDPATGTRVQAKYHINADNFRPGYVTPDDRWDNYWRAGRNAWLGWNEGAPGHGQGAKSLGMELANSDAFASCQAKKVYQTVCLKEPTTETKNALAAVLKSSNYNMKTLFAQAATRCMGD
jgi:hypothetical protein